MKRILHWLIPLLAFLLIFVECVSSLSSEKDFALFGKIPVQVGGRVKPLDTVARNSLLIIHGRGTVQLDNGTTLQATHWLADLLYKATEADHYPVFVIYNPDVLGLFGWQQTNRKFFSYEEISPFLKKIDDQSQLAEPVESVNRTPFQTAILNLRNAILLYQRLRSSLQPEGSEDFTSELEEYVRIIPAGIEAVRNHQKKEPMDQDALDEFSQFSERYEMMGDWAYISPVPPKKDHTGLHGDWLPVGKSLLESIASGQIHPVVEAYALIGTAYRSNDKPLFRQRVTDLYTWMNQHQPESAYRARYEYLFNVLNPFYESMQLYILVFLLVCGVWLGGAWSENLRTAAVNTLLLAFLIHTWGLGSRMWLQERPPVTNLYSSAIFIGWGSVIIGLILERIFKEGIGLACSAAIGFVTLIIAYHLSESGDTLEMLRAVLDTNIWLATHVVVITIGYSAMFFAGMLAMIYVIRGIFTTSLTKTSAKNLSHMIYGVICFATLFSFVGTVLGGIWADQSWGRFWGWDPKENGALMIVLWCAIILHARLAGKIREQGLVVMTLFGNVITSFSWFGVNMLGIGLHSYGFMNKAFPWLVGFVMSQLILMALAAIPFHHWRSFAPQNTPS